MAAPCARWCRKPLYHRVRHAHDGVVNRCITVRVIFTDHVTDHAGRLFVSFVPVIPQHIHRIKHAAMHRFQAITDVRQRTSYDDTHGIVQVGLAHLVFEVYLQHFFGEFGHMSSAILELFSGISGKLLFFQSIIVF